MADVITRLKVESQEYDSKIKRAAQGLLQMETACRKVGGTLAVLEKDEKEFVAGLGRMETSSRTAKGKLSELTNAFTDLRAQYNRLTAEEKQGDFGRALSQSLDQLKVRIIDTKKELKGIQAEIGDGGGFKGLMTGISGKLGISPAMFTGIGAAVATAGAAFKAFGDNVRTAMNFETSMSKLSSLTGKTGKDLETLKEYAIELGSTTTLTASQVADAFRLIGSQQPQLLESSEALKEVTKQAITLAEAAGIDLATASQTLSTSINQMGGDSKNAARFVNVLAAASQKGAGDIAWLGEAITKSGTAAKAVGVSYEELVANLEQLAKAGFDASTAGTALRSIIMNLEKQANSQFKPSIVGLTQAFKNLGAANLSIVEYQKLTGKMFATQAMALAEAATEAEKMREAITGTNIAEEQAATNTDNLSGSLKSLASAWEGLNLHINSSNGFLKTCVDWLKDVIKWADAAFTSAGRAAKELAKMQGGGEKDGKHINTRTEQEVEEVRNATQGEGDAAKIRQRQIIDNYEREIEAYKRSLDAIRKWQAGDRSDDVRKQMTEYQKLPENKGIVLNTSTIENRLKALNTMLNEFKTESDKILNTESPTPETTKPTPSITEDGDNDKTKGKTPQQQAQAKYDQAQKDYQQALEQAALEVKAGTSDTVAAKKKELQAAENLWKSIGDAREVYDSEELKKAQEDAAQKVVELGGSVKQLEAEQKKAQEAARELTSAQKKAADAYRNMQDARANNDLKAYNTARKQYESAQAEVKRLGGDTTLPQKETVEVEYVVTSNTLNVLQELKELEGVHIDEKTMSVTFDDEEAKQKAEELQGYKFEPKEIEVNVEQPKPVEVPVEMSYTESNMSAFISILKEKIAQEDVGSTLYQNLTKQLADANALANLIETAVKNGIDLANFNPQELWAKVLNGNPGDYIEDSTWEGLKNYINEKLKEMKLDPIELNLQTGDVNTKKGKSTKSDDNSSAGMGQLLSGVSSINSNLSSLGAEIPESLSTVVTVLEAISGILTGISTLVTVISAETSIKSIPVIGWALAGGGIVPRAAGGKIIEGNSYSGDNIFAGGAFVNAGELVLNKAQQGNLASILSDGGVQRGGDSVAIVSSDNIKFVLKNGAQRRGKTLGEYLGV